MEMGTINSKDTRREISQVKKLLHMVGGEIDALCERITLYLWEEDGELHSNARNPK